MLKCAISGAKGVLGKKITNTLPYKFYPLKEKIENFNKPEQVVSSIKEIWHNAHINKVRKKHVEGKIEDVKICKNCTFKDTYKWERV